MKTPACWGPDHEAQVRERVAEIVSVFHADIAVTTVVRARARLLNSGLLHDRQRERGCRSWACCENNRIFSRKRYFSRENRRCTAILILQVPLFRYVSLQGLTVRSA